MRLLNALTLELSLFRGNAPEYVILSYQWEDEKVTFEDIAKNPISDLESLTRRRDWAKSKGLAHSLP